MSNYTDIYQRSRSPKVCPKCGLSFRVAYWHPTRGAVCPVCQHPLKSRARKRTPKRRHSGAAAPDVGVHENDYFSIEPGHPLGVGMPTGSPLRVDGETHREAWFRILRSDPCAYCGGPADTVDHIEPQDPLKPIRGIGGKHDWSNLTAACVRCNGSKGNRSLLSFLSLRPAQRGFARPARASAPRAGEPVAR